MALMFTRAKRVSDPLNERVKARLLHGTSDHDDSSDVDDHSFFPNLIHGFFDLDDDHNHNEYSTTSDSDVDSTANETVDTVQALLHPSQKSSVLRSDVIRVAEALSSLRPSTGSYADNDKYMQFVVATLREMGYNAGVCRTKWVRSCSGSGLIAGSYEYIDVVEEEGKERYIVDLEFREQFEVARATEEYEKVVGAVPRLLVGREEEVRKAVKVVAEAAKRSMRRRGMGVPPWRKRRYVLAKWFGHYRRTVSSPAVLGCVSGGENIKCRSVVGFRAEAETIKLSALS